MFNKKRKNEIIDEELELESYDSGDMYDLDRDEVFYSEDMNDVEEIDSQDSDYTSFNSVSEYDPTEDDLYDKTLQEEKEETNSRSKTISTKKSKVEEHSGFTGFLMNYSTIIKIVGIFLMIVVVAYYLSVGRLGALFLYLILLVLAYFFGFGCMYLVTVNKK